jgi:pimeloyl-ACP methyl ester carboxylesterase
MRHFSAVILVLWMGALTISLPARAQVGPSSGGDGRHQTTGELEYEIRGRGEPILLIHGAYFEDALVPITNDEALAGYQRIHYHRRGFANSAGHDGAFTIEGEAADALALLQYLQIDRAHVVGYSSGGVIAFELARSAPDAVHTLILIEPALQLPGSIDRGMPPFLARSFEFYEAGDTSAAVDRFWQEVSPSAEWQAAVEAGVMGVDMNQAMRNADLFFELEAKAVLAYPFDQSKAELINRPILYVLGSLSAPRSAELRELVRVSLPQTEEILIENADHSLPMLRPREIAMGVNAFLMRHPM